MVMKSHQIISCTDRFPFRAKLKCCWVLKLNLKISLIRDNIGYFALYSNYTRCKVNK